MGELRDQLRERLVEFGLPDDDLERLILVVDEVVSNSIEHGHDYRQSVEPIRVGIRKSDDGVVLEVDDVDVPQDVVTSLSREFGSTDDVPPSADMERGRGMFLVTMFLEDLQVVWVEGGGMRLQGRLTEDRG